MPRSMRTAGWAILAVVLAPGGVRAQAGKPSPPLRELHRSADRPYVSLAFSADGRFFGAGAEGAVKILCAEDDGFADVTLLRPRGRVDELIFDYGADVLVSRSRGLDPVVWDAATWTPLRYAVDDQAFGDLALRENRQDTLDPGASCLVLSHRQRGLRLWTLQGLRGASATVVQQDLSEWKGLPLGRVTAIAWGDDALVAGDDRGQVTRMPEARKLLDKLDTTALVLGTITRGQADAGRFRAHQGEVTAVGLASEAERCVTAGTDGKVRLWDTRKIPGGTRTSAVAPEWEIPGLTAEISPDGKLLAVAHDAGVAVYHAGAGLRLAWNPTPGARAVRLRFDPTGDRLAAILCRCAECRTGAATRRPLADHGGELLIWK